MRSGRLNSNVKKNIKNNVKTKGVKKAKLGERLVDVYREEFRMARKAHQKKKSRQINQTHKNKTLLEQKRMKKSGTSPQSRFDTNQNSNFNRLRNDPRKLGFGKMGKKMKKASSQSQSAA